MAEGAQTSKCQWEGKPRAKIVGCTPEKVWPLLDDFCHLNKYLPTIDTCYQVAGVTGQPGLTRFCASTKDGEVIHWCHEKLLAIDNVERCLTYELVDGNMGLNSYVATHKILPLDDDDGDDQQLPGCQIEWSFVCDPIEGYAFEDFLSTIDSNVHAMAEHIAKFLQPSQSQ